MLENNLDQPLTFDPTTTNKKVEIQVDLEQLDEDLAQNDGGDDGEDANDVSNDDMMQTDEDGMDEGTSDPQSKKRAVQWHVNKLDQMLLITFEHLDRW